MVNVDHLTQASKEEDLPYLRSKLLDVSIRLLLSSAGYRLVVATACHHIKWLCLTKHEGYRLPYGMSGANAGIPWNIVGISRRRGRPDAWCEIFINPVVVASSETLEKAISSCGSVPEAGSIDIWRHAWVDVEWYTEQGEKQQKRFTRDNGGFSLQHEIDHNNGILITDHDNGL